MLASADSSWRSPPGAPAAAAASPASASPPGATRGGFVSSPSASCPLCGAHRPAAATSAGKAALERRKADLQRELARVEGLIARQLRSDQTAPTTAQQQYSSAAPAVQSRSIAAPADASLSREQYALIADLRATATALTQRSRAASPTASARVESADRAGVSNLSAAGRTALPPARADAVAAAFPPARPVPVPAMNYPSPLIWNAAASATRRTEHPDALRHHPVPPMLSPARDDMYSAAHNDVLRELAMLRVERELSLADTVRNV